MNASAAGECQQNDASEMNTLGLVIRCYEVLVRDLETARQAHARKDEEELFQKVHHAQDILTELLIGLDHDRGGVIAQNLDRIYQFLLRELTAIQPSVPTVNWDVMIRIVNELRVTWEKLASHPQAA